MKLSRYNFLKKIDGDTVFFNAITCALAIVDRNFLRIVDDVKNNCYNEIKYDSELIRDMKISGCIIEDEVDEIEQLEFYRNLAKYDMTKFSLTIAPTLDCNFRCKYCFEKHPKGVMNANTQEKLIRFVESRLKVAKSFSVTWYGGEPLLSKNIVYNLSEKFLELYARGNISYSAFIVTNASLMDITDINEFKKYKIGRVQITIDGPKEIHDQRRKNITGESTFDKLIENTNHLLNNDLSVSIRINVDKENINSIDELLQTLSTRIEKYKDLKIGFGKVTSYTEICKSIESDCYSNEQFADILLPLYDKVTEYDFKVSRNLIYPMLRLNYCGCAEYANSFVVDNHGILYKCWNAIGDTKNSCGNVNHYRIEGSYLDWVLRNPMHHPKCKDCQYLPICMGGCPNTMRKAGEPICGTIKYNLDKILEYHYRKIKTRKY